MIHSGTGRESDMFGKLRERRLIMLLVEAVGIGQQTVKRCSRLEMPNLHR